MSSATLASFAMVLIVGFIVIREVRKENRRPVNAKICFGWLPGHLDDLLTSLLIAYFRYRFHPYDDKIILTADQEE